jgi:hypothetical protein
MPDFLLPVPNKPLPIPFFSVIMSFPFAPQQPGGMRVSESRALLAAKMWPFAGGDPDT